MSARRLDGTAVAMAVRSELAGEVTELTARLGRPPSLTIVLAGDDPASQGYVSHKEKAGAATGLDVTVHRLAATSALDEVLDLVARLNTDDGTDGILVQADRKSTRLNS